MVASPGRRFKQELEGPLLEFLLELQHEQVVTKITLPHAREPERWILAEEADLYRTAFAVEPSKRRSPLRSSCSAFSTRTR